MTIQHEFSIQATGSYLPPNVVTNDELAQWLDTSDEWVVEHTGIRERRWAAPDESTSDLGAGACRVALERAAVDAADVDLVICATSSPDWIQPATAAAIHGKLEMREASGAMDINAVCSGFVYALRAGTAMLAAEADWNHVLVVGAECYTKITNPDDRTTSIFFGDGAGAVLLGRKGASSILATALGNDFSRHEAIIVPAGGTVEPITPEGIEQGRHYFAMQGTAVKDFAVPHLASAVREACERAGVAVADLALVVPHQSNLRIIEAAAAELGLDMQRVAVTVDRYGNTAGASIPITLDDAAQAGRIKAGDLICLVGYGGGLSWAAAVLRW